MDSPQSSPPSSPQSPPPSSPPSSLPSPPQEEPVHRRGDPFAASSSRSPTETEQNDAKKMVGFGSITERSLPEEDRGPPYFYYENSATASEGVWQTMKQFLFGIEPEFVDSQYFSAAIRRSGYIHNLPIMNRFMPEPLPKMTIGEAFPWTNRWWPDWDERTKMNMETSLRAEDELLDDISQHLDAYNGNPPADFIRQVSDHCRNFNLTWVRRNKVDNLDSTKIETLLGFPENYTRCIHPTNRFNVLHNSSQVDTVVYHLSILKQMFNKGITVLSLLTGIGAEVVALHCLQIPLKVVVSVEISRDKRDALDNFWTGNDLTGKLIQFADVHSLTDEVIHNLMLEFGGFDLVIGCNKILQERRLPLFYQFWRVLVVVGV